MPRLASGTTMQLRERREPLGSPPMIPSASGSPSAPARTADSGVPPTAIQTGRDLRGFVAWNRFGSTDGSGRPASSRPRGAATDAVLGGKAHVNGVRVKPSKDVRPGDRLEVTIGDARRGLVVRGVAEKRGPASVAATLYEETRESIARREQRAAARRLARPLGADLGAPPTKRDRRRLDALRRAQRRSRRSARRDDGHQSQRPRTAISAGRARRGRSSRRSAPRARGPTPISLTTTIWEVANAPMAKQNSGAAAVMR